MAYVHPFMRLTCSGALYENERFSVGFTLVNTQTGTPLAEDVVPAAVVTAVKNYFAASFISEHASLDVIKWNQIGLDGKYLSKTESCAAEVNPKVTGGGGEKPPAQIALAVSMRTAHARGLAHAGRFYVPVPSVPILATGLVQASDVIGVVTATTTLVNALNAATTAWRVGVVSNVRGGAENLVTHIAVGEALDTIRSRRKKMPENYHVGPEITQP
jgi:hypothetical protein